MGIETTQIHSQSEMAIQLLLCAQCDESRAKHILLLTFVPYRFVECLLHRSETGTYRIWGKLITILRKVTQQRYFPCLSPLASRLSPISHLPRHLCLIINEVGFVVTCCLQCTQQIARGLIAYAVHLTVRTITPTHITTGTQQTHIQARFQSGRAFVANIQYGRHLVAILSIETTCREIYTLNHVGIHKTQSLLLTAAYQ